MHVTRGVIVDSVHRSSFAPAICRGACQIRSPLCRTTPTGNYYYRFDDHLSRLVLDYEASRRVDENSDRLYHDIPSEDASEDLFRTHNVKRGLRNADGSGVVAGLTRISDVHGYNVVDGRVVPDEGHLILRGYDLEDLIECPEGGPFWV